MAGWWDRLVDRFREADRAAAAKALADFEAHHGLDRTAGGIHPATLDDVRHALTPRRMPLVEHHWATWCAPCIDELDRIERLAAAVRGHADVVGVSWDRFERAGRAMDETLAEVGRVAAAHGLSWPTWVVDAEPDDLFDALDPPARTVPQTRVLDADGGILRTFDTHLEEADVADLIELLTGRTP